MQSKAENFFWHYHGSTSADPVFFRGGANPIGGANLLFGQNVPKTAWKWRKLGRGGGLRPKFYYVDPPLVRGLVLKWNISVWIVNWKYWSFSPVCKFVVFFGRRESRAVPNLREGVPTIYFPNFSERFHEIKNKLVQWGEVLPCSILKSTNAQCERAFTPQCDVILHTLIMNRN